MAIIQIESPRTFSACGNTLTSDRKAGLADYNAHRIGKIPIGTSDSAIMGLGKLGTSTVGINCWAIVTIAANSISRTRIIFVSNAFAEALRPRSHGAKCDEVSADFVALIAVNGARGTRSPVGVGTDELAVSGLGQPGTRTVGDSI